MLIYKFNLKIIKCCLLLSIYCFTWRSYLYDFYSFYI